MPAVTTATGSANIAGQIRIDYSSCSSRGNLYEMFLGPDSAAENVSGAPLRTVYVRVSAEFVSAGSRSEAISTASSPQKVPTRLIEFLAFFY